MKDLQEFFEQMGYDKFKELSTLMEKKNLNPKSQALIGGYIGTIYCAEKNVDEANLTTEEMQEVWDSFFMSVAIYENVLNGHMEIKDGRMMLTDGKSCSFSLTKEGIESVEKMLKK